MAEQTRQAIRNMRTVLEAAGGTLDDIVSIVVYTTDMREFKNIVAARMEFFKDKLPTSTIVEVNHLADPGLLIEFQAIAALYRSKCDETSDRQYWLHRFRRLAEAAGRRRRNPDRTAKRSRKSGRSATPTCKDCDLVVDANGVTAGPGFIDSHVHIAFGDYTPRLTAVGFLQNYLHGGHHHGDFRLRGARSGRPHTCESVKALAVAAKQCWDNYRPGGMRVHGGNVILEPGMTD